MYDTETWCFSQNDWGNLLTNQWKTLVYTLIVTYQLGYVQVKWTYTGVLY